MNCRSITCQILTISRTIARFLFQRHDDQVAARRRGHAALVLVMAVCLMAAAALALHPVLRRDVSAAAEKGISGLLRDTGRKLGARLGLAAPVQTQQVPQLTISTIAGGGMQVDTPVARAAMGRPLAVVRDPQGRGFYVHDQLIIGSDTPINLIRFVNTTAQTVTLAGTAISAKSIGTIAGGGLSELDGTAARDALFESITGLAVDPSGNALYIHAPAVSAIYGLNVSTQNVTIGTKTLQPGKIQGVITDSTIRFDGSFSSQALAIDPATRAFYYVDSKHAFVYRAEAGGGSPTLIAGTNTDVPGSNVATQVKLSEINGLAADASGNVYLSEGVGARASGNIRKVSGNTISTLAGNLLYPIAVTLATNGDVFAAIGNDPKIVRIPAAGGSPVMVVGNTTGSGGGSASCTGGTVDCGDGGNAIGARLSMTESGDADIFQFAADSTGLILPGYFYNRVRYANLGAGAVTLLDKSIGGLKIDSIVGNGLQTPYDNSDATTAIMDKPQGLAADTNGNLFIGEAGGRLRYVNRTDSPVTLFGGTFSAQTIAPRAMATLNNQAGADDGQIATSNFGRFAMMGMIRTANGLYICDVGRGINYPNRSTGKRSGMIRFVNMTSANVSAYPGMPQISPGGIQDIVGVISTAPRDASFSVDDGTPAREAVVYPTDIAIGADGVLYIADSNFHKIRRVETSGVVNTQLVDTGDGKALNTPSGIAFANGKLHIADTKNNRILRQNSGSSFSVIADTTHGVNAPRGIAVDSQGNVYVTNSGTQRTLFIKAAGTPIGPVAGNGTTGFSGDGGLGTLARLNLYDPLASALTPPTNVGIKVLADDSVILSDTENNRIRYLKKSINVAPALTAISAQTMLEGQSLTVNFTASDANSDALVFSHSGKPAFGAFTDNGDGTAKIVFTPSNTDAGIYNLTITVSDGVLTDSNSFSLNVTDTNRPPVVTAAPINTPITATSASGASVSLAGTISDPDNNPVTWKWFDGATEIASGSGTTANTTVTLSLGFHTIFLQATDNNGGSTSSAAQLIQISDPTAPVIGTIPANQEFEGDTIGGKVFNFSNPTVTDNIDPNPQLQVSGRPPGDLFPVGVTTVNFTAIDSSGNIAVKSFTVKVNDTQKPVITGVPANVNAEADTLGGKIVNFVPPTASDIVSGNVIVQTSGAPAGNKFPVGVTNVNFSATDGAGNNQTASFTVTITDTTKPVMSGIPANQTVEATSGAGAVVSYTLPTATDIVDGAVTVTTDKPSGSTFAIGTTTVNFSAKDARNNTTTASFSVTVQDTTAPVFSNVPVDRIVAKTSDAGANVTFTPPTASDAVDGPVQVTSSHASGALFPIGDTTITFTARDSRNNTRTASFKISVVTNPPPVISGVPANVTLEATSPAGAAFSYLMPTALDSRDGPTPVTTTHPSGTTFPLGMTTVTFSSTNSLGLTSTASFKVTVVDTTPPAFTGSSPDLLTEALSPSGANVIYALPGAVDLVDGPVAVTASKASGSLFPIGVTTVTLTAKDTRQNMTSRTFTVTVLADISYVISTFAGSGGYGSGGDGGAATEAQFRQNTALARDPQGRLVIADTASRVIRRVDTDGTITRIAGNGANGNAGDNGQAISASFGAPTGVAVDSQGNIYVSDQFNHRVRVIGTDNVIRHFAGSTTAQQGSSGDFGMASGARLRMPRGLAIDKNDNLYVADSGNHRVRKIVLSSKVISPLAGTGVAGYTGDGSLATTLNLNNPTGLGLDNAGNLYIADTGNHRVRRVDAGSGFMSTVTGNGAAGFAGDNGPAENGQVNTPADVSVDGRGNIFIADQGNQRIRRISSATGRIRTVAGTGQTGFAGDGGPAADALLSVPNAILADSGGNNILFSDSANLRIRRLSAGVANRAPVITSAIGNQSLVKNQTLDIALAASDEDNDSVTFTLLNAPAFAAIVNASPAARTATLRLTPTAAGQFNGVQVRADDGKGGAVNTAAFNISVTEPQQGNQNPTASAAALPAIIEATSAAGASVNLSGNASDPDNDTLTYAWRDGAAPIAGTANATVTLALGAHNITLTVTDGKGGSFTTPSQSVQVRDTTPPVISGVPQDISVNAGGPVAVNFALPTANDIVSGAVPVQSAPAPNSVFPAGMTTVNFTATDGAGNTANASFKVTVTVNGGGGGGGVADDPVYDISTKAGNGMYGYTGDNGPATAASLRQISALARDTQGNLYIADIASRVVRRVNPQGTITTYAGSGLNGNSGDGRNPLQALFGMPSGVAVDGQGNLYIADMTYNRVRRISPGGAIIHYAGDSNGVAGSSGDLGNASQAKLRQPRGLAVDAAGNLYIADAGNHLIRRVDAVTRIITTYAGNGVSGYSGDGQPARQGSLFNPYALAIDGAGNLLIADSANHRIRQVDAASQFMSTVAGNGLATFGGDDGNAIAAQLHMPTGVAVDAQGNFYIADQNNHRIRRVNRSTGKIRTIAGTGLPGFGGDGGPALLGQVSGPIAILVNAAGTELCIGDLNNQRVRKLAATGAPANHNPVPAAVASQVTTVSQPIDVLLAATDADGDAVTFTLQNGTAFMSIVNSNPAARTATLRIAPGGANAGTYNNLVIVATDSKNGTGQTPPFSVTINPDTQQNRNPVVGAIGNQTVAPGQTIDVPVSASDADNDPVSFSLLNAPAYVTLVNANPAARTATLRIAPPTGTATGTSFGLLVAASDGRGGSGQSNPFSVAVSATQTNRNPTAVIAGGASVTVDATSASGALVTLNGAGSSDPDGDPLTYLWQDGSTPIGTAAVITPTLGPGTHNISLTVSDGRGGTGTATQTVTVRQAQQGAVALTAVSPGTGRQGQTLDIIVSGNNLKPGAVFTFSGSGITAQTLSLHPLSAVIRVSIDRNAPVSGALTGRRSITVTNVDGQSATLPAVFQVTR
ncbi:MAG: HYR domain-containing protein [Blastocatellia bacterium]